MREIKMESLTQALNKMLGTSVISVEFQTKQLHGGTVGDVQLVTGKAKTNDGTDISCKIILKVQMKWERYGDPDSWRREYDFYTSNLGALFSETFRWPECYQVEMNEEKMKRRSGWNISTVYRV